MIGRSKLRLAVAVLAALALLVSTAGGLLAFQPPLTALGKAEEGPVYPGAKIKYEIGFKLGASADDVVVVDRLRSTVGILTKVSTVTCYYNVSNPCPNGVVETLESRFPTRETWSFSLGDLPAGLYYLVFDACVPEEAPIGTVIRNEADVYAASPDGGWKGTTQVTNKVLLPDS